MKKIAATIVTGLAMITASVFMNGCVGAGAAQEQAYRQELATLQAAVAQMPNGPQKVKAAIQIAQLQEAHAQSQAQASQAYWTKFNAIWNTPDY